MPVNMDPKKRRTFLEDEPISDEHRQQSPSINSKKFDEETERDREQELADAEAINLIGSDHGYG